MGMLHLYNLWIIRYFQCYYYYHYCFHLGGGGGGIGGLWKLKEPEGCLLYDLKLGQIHEK